MARYEIQDRSGTLLCGFSRCDGAIRFLRWLERRRQLEQVRLVTYDAEGMPATYRPDEVLHAKPR